MRMINIHTHHATGAENIIEVVNQYPAQADPNIRHYSIGMHPWHIDPEHVEAELRIIRDHLTTENCLAIGECGLDKRTETPFGLQEQVFERHLQLAQEYKKPVIIHCVAAFQELIAMRNAMTISVPLVVHGFSKSPELAKQLLDNGFYLSFGKYLLLNPGLEETFGMVPDDRYFLETDSAANSILSVYERAAIYRKQTLEQVSTQTASNFSSIFKNIIT